MQNYRQADPRWGSYPYAGDNMAGSGCGPTSIANIVGNSPKEVADWLTAHGYASDGSGTYWEGIAPALTAFRYPGQQLNYNNLHGAYGSGPEQTWKSAMASGQYYGILLMGPGMFANAGHFITITEYVSGKCYVHDPAYAPRDGWHSWEDFGGDVKVFYLAKKKEADVEPAPPAKPDQPNTTYAFNPPQIQIGDTGVVVLLLEEILGSRGIYKGALDRSFGPGLRDAVMKYQHLRNLAEDGICGPATWKDLLAL
ncbi:MAG: peptidoglycan-binding protein [Lachnospiraceae bacterium]|nr:peptidoglycan-binding protein [Lachnospiraceae bacterium]